MASDVVVERRGTAAWLTIDRPEKRNALSDTVVEGLIEGLSGAEDATCVVVTGAGDRVFCAGGDLTGAMAAGGEDAERRRGRIGDLLMAILAHPRPVVARVNGAALAGGFGLMMACDLVVAADDVEVGTPEVNVGLWPFMISAILRRNLPRKVLTEMMMLGRRLPVSELERWGAVNRVAPRAELDAAVDEVVAELSSKSPMTLRLGKESFLASDAVELRQALDYLNTMLTRNVSSPDVAEGVAAFLERRAPRWSDR